MPRLTQGEEYFDVARDGARVVQVSGQHGRREQRKETSLDSVDAASKMVSSTVAKKQKAGFTLLPLDPSTDAALGYIAGLEAAEAEGVSLDAPRPADTLPSSDSWVLHGYRRFNDLRGATPLLNAAWNRQHEAVEWLLARGVSLTSRAQDGATVLHVAAAGQMPSLLSAGLAAGVSADVKDHRGQRPLHYLKGRGAVAQRVEIIDALVAAGADVNATDRDGNGPVDVVGPDCEAEVLKRLLDAGAKPMKPAAIGEILKSEHGAEKAALLTAAGIQLSGTLTAAATAGSVEGVRAALAAGDSPDTVDPDRHWPALRLAVESGNVDAAGALLDAGADPDLTDETGWTALHEAARQRSLPMVERLLQGGADPLAKLRESVSFDDQESYRYDSTAADVGKKAGAGQSLVDRLRAAMKAPKR